jgi:hypothetical protein
MKHDTAQKVTGLLEGAIQNMSLAISIAENEMKPDDFETFKKEIGISIGRVSMGADIVYNIHGDLTPSSLV